MRRYWGVGCGMLDVGSDIHTERLGSVVGWMGGGCSSAKVPRILI
jgi:hypothetical protein